MSFKDAALWVSAQANVPKEYAEHAERLRSELFKSRTKAAILAGRIATSFPSLTLHDLSHLDGLWEVGSLIAGPKYCLNPLEAFVFGTAILLHDAALCFEAYDGGQSAVRATLAWKDAFVLEQRKNPAKRASELEAIADFVAVRSLHAEQAAKLVHRAWPDPATGEPYYLIEDTHLRKHLGKLIGDIAASHHWSIEKVRAELPRQTNAPAELPSTWCIEPRKLACLLRCADALHIDNRRAPDFFHALLRRSGVSFDHWRAQNQIGRIDLDRSDHTGQTALLSTTKPFLEVDAASWWLIYDAACVAQRELESSNALLVADSTAPFQVNRIRGIESPELMASFVRAEGWSPCSAAIHISNIEQLIRSLGGTQLYGTNADAFAVAIRELVQNSRDAVKAREKVDPHFRGLIKVRVSRATPTVVEVEDSGIGMSQRVLTGPLLDFGTSFWASSLVQSEFPGLSSSGFSPVGKFGIGFYSVFMVSDHVTVSSRRWDEGLRDTHQLVFSAGVALRPLLKHGVVSNVGANTSTLIALTLHAGVLEDDRSVTIKTGMLNVPDLKIPLAEYLSVVVAGLDVDVAIEVEGFEAVRHIRQPLEPAQGTEWLNRLAFINHRDPSAGQLLQIAVGNRLKPIFEGDRCVGLAAISALPQQRLPFGSLVTVGGLAVSAQGARANFYIGFMDHEALSAKRDQGERSASSDTIGAWANEQLALLKTSGLQPVQRAAVAYGLAQFGVDPTEIALFPFWSNKQLEFLTIDQVIERVRNCPLLFWKASMHDNIDSYHQKNDYDGHLIFQPADNGDFNSLKLLGGAPAVRCSAIGCLHAAMIRAGIKPSFEIRENVSHTMIGAVHALILKAANA